MPAPENNKERAPFEHYRALFEKLDPAEAAERCGVAFDAEKGLFALRLLYADYQIKWPTFDIRSEDASAFALSCLPAQVLILRYLLEGRYSEGSGRFKTYRELPWGEVYVKPFTGRCLNRAAYAFGTRLEAFRRAVGAWPAIPLNRGDAGFQLVFMPGYDIQLLIWEGDDEFPPNCQLLFSDNFPLAFSAEDRTVVGDILISDIKRRMEY